jgi:DNA-binding CsgD family transcriptional regulator
MLTQTPTKHNFISTLEKSDTQSIQSDITLLKIVIESFIDGILILTEQGEWVQSNEHARQICEKLTPGKVQPNSVPEEIWRVGRALIESRRSYPNQPVILESEITTDKQTPLRVRVRWFRLNAISSPCLLVILEDRYESIQNLAIAEVDQYGLTPREAEVWLLHRTNDSHKKIAEELYISLNTVKKHLKNIHAKRKAFATKHAEKLPSWVSQLG